jgi:hypothetical protein
MLGQSFTNMVQPATEQIARALTGSSSSSNRLFSSPTQQQQQSRIFPRALPKTELPVEFPDEFAAPKRGGSGGAMGGLFDLANSFLRRTNGADGEPLSTAQRPLPSLRQLMPGANRNFGVQQGDGGCLRGKSAGVNE